MSPGLKVTPVHRNSSNDLCHVLRIMFCGVSGILMSITMHTFLNYFTSDLICSSASLSLLVLKKVLNYISSTLELSCLWNSDINMLLCAPSA